MTTTHYTSILADSFGDALTRHLTPVQLDAAILDNAQEPDSHTCHTHDYCDANEAMADAFTRVVGRAPDVSSDADSALWNAAWTLWRTRTTPSPSHAAKILALGDVLDLLWDGSDWVEIDSGADFISDVTRIIHPFTK